MKKDKRTSEKRDIYKQLEDWSALYGSCRKYAHAHCGKNRQA
jgi:hypothetical protein